MTMDAPLVAAATLHRAYRMDPRDCEATDVTRQLQLAHVLLDGGYDGVTTLEEALAGGDTGLGTVDRLDGELVVVDGQPWRVDWQGRAELLPLQTRTPFAVVSSMDDPKTQRLQDVDREQVLACIQDLTGDPGAVITVRIEGAFEYVLVRSVPPQDPPYRPYVEVCQTDEVRWEHKPFFGVFVGFVFPDLSPGAAIPGLHLHGLDRMRTTGGHNHEMRVRDAKLSVSASRDVIMQLPERSMTDFLETPDPARRVQRELLRSGASSVARLAVALDVSEAHVQSQLQWLADRGYVMPVDQDGQTHWRTSLRAPASRASGRVADLLDSL
jgi:acetolactate decarboxylase